MLRIGEHVPVDGLSMWDPEGMEPSPVHGLSSLRGRSMLAWGTALHGPTPAAGCVQVEMPPTTVPPNASPAEIQTDFVLRKRKLAVVIATLTVAGWKLKTVGDVNWMCPPGTV